MDPILHQYLLFEQGYNRLFYDSTKNLYKNDFEIEFNVVGFELNHIPSPFCFKIAKEFSGLGHWCMIV